MCHEPELGEPNRLILQAFLHRRGFEAGERGVAICPVAIIFATISRPVKLAGAGNAAQVFNLLFHRLSASRHQTDNGSQRHLWQCKRRLPPSRGRLWASIQTAGLARL